MNQAADSPSNQLNQPRRQKKLRAYVQVGRWLLVFSLPAILCVTVLVQTFRERQAVRAASRSAEAAVQQLQLENQRLREEIEALRHDPEVIERIAREELNMLRPDELVLSFPDKAEESDTAVKKTEADKILTQPANRHPSTGHHTEPRRDHD